MKNKIKIVYDWFGPHYPLANNQEDLLNALEQSKNKIPLDFYDNLVQHGVTVFPFRTMEIFKDSEKYEYASASSVGDDDIFMYEITLNPNLITSLHEIDLLSTTSITEKTIDLIRNCNGYLLLEICNESISHFDTLHSYFKSKSIPLNKVIILTGTANIKEQYDTWCSLNEIGAERLVVGYFEWFEWVCSKNLNDQKEKAFRNTNFYKVQKTFLSYNRTFKPHRSNLLISFFKQALLVDTYFSMSDISEDGIPWKEVYWKEVDQDNYNVQLLQKKMKPIFNITIDTINDVNGTLPLRIDSSVTMQDKLKLIYPEESLYDVSLLSVVTESNFENNAIFNTEKIWKAIANRHPFIIVGPAKTLQHLKLLGYKTYSDFFNEGYDLDEDPGMRLLKIVMLCKEISNWSRVKKRDFFYESMKISDYNYKLLSSIHPNNKRTDFIDSFYNWQVK